MQTLLLTSHFKTTILVDGVQNIFFLFFLKNPQWHNDMSFLMDVFQPQKTGVDQIFLWEFFRRPSETKMSSFEVILRPKNIRPAAWFQKTKYTKLKKKNVKWIQSRGLHIHWRGPNKETNPSSKLPSHFFSSGINFSDRTCIRRQWERVSLSKIKAPLSQILQ